MKMKYTRNGNDISIKKVYILWIENNEILFCAIIVLRFLINESIP